MTRRARNGSTAILVGGTLLARAMRTFTRSRRRAAVQGLVGAGLLVFGLRQRRSGRSESTADEAGALDAGGDETILDKVRSAVARQNVADGSDVNPRGVANEPDVETKTDPRGGSVKFTEAHDEDPHSRPSLDEEPHDSRRNDRDDGEGEIDLSEVALADEASEATGPDPEQAQPASTEETEPEPTPEEDASHVRADEPSEPNAESDAEDDDARGVGAGDAGGVDADDERDGDEAHDDEDAA